MDAVEEIKSRLSIEDVISQYVELKRAGRNLKGLSPFGNERTPSFMVSPEKQIWHDFSSGKGGNMFSFIMEMEGLDFRGALELLARKAGVELEQYKGSRPQNKNKDRLFAVLEAAAHFYQFQFTKSTLAIEYVKKRQFTRETVLEWRLGYSPESGSELVTYLRNKTFTDAEIKEAGLGTQRYRGFGDMFRGRLMIPLQDPEGRVIGFTARILKDDPEAPKYINTPQSPVYDKSRHIFGLHLAKNAIRRSEYAVLVEGNLDVIQSHQAGVRQVVATAGTALTEHHLKTLRRFTDDIRLCFDADNAGLNATERAIPIAQKLDIALSIVSVSEGKDPDELIKTNLAAWQKTIETKQDAITWIIERSASKGDLTDSKHINDFKNNVYPVLLKIESLGEREKYAKKVADVFGYKLEAVTEELKLRAKGSKSYAPVVQVQKRLPTAEQKVRNDYVKIQNNLLAILFLSPKTRERIDKLLPQMFIEESAKELFVFLVEHRDFVYKSTDDKALRSLEDYVKLLLLLYEELYQDLEFNELQYEVTRLQDQLIDRYVKSQKSRIAHELKTTDDENRKIELLKIDSKLNHLLKTHKGGA